MSPITLNLSALAALGEMDRAREALDSALAANPNNAEALDALVKLGA